MKKIPNDAVEAIRRKRETGTCIACLRPRARALMPGDPEDFCQFHVTIWDVPRRAYETRRVGGRCVYCGSFATFRRVHCDNEDCEMLHEQNVNIVIEHLEAKGHLPPHNIADRKSKMRRYGVPYHFYEEGLCQLT